MNDTIEITAVAHGGAGVGRIDGQVCFVPYGIPGDQLSIKITRRTKKILWAELVEVLEPSPDRTKPDYPGWTPSGVSTWLHFKYPAQGKWKREIVQSALSRIAGIDEVELGWREDSGLRTAYRTRAEFHDDGKLFGFYALGSHDIVDTTRCPLCHPAMNEALKALRELGLKGSVTVTVNPEGEEVLVWTGFQSRRLKDRFPLAGSSKDEQAPARFMFDGVPIVNGGFSQSSLLLNRLLVETVHQYVGKASSVLDLYCGNGNLTLKLPERCEVTGIDHNRIAVKAADSVGRGSYFAGQESKMIQRIGEGQTDVIVLDPPRAGAKALIPALAKSKARSIVYVSCDPATLARDLKGLYGGGWKITQIAALDLFPNTAHVETVCLLKKD
ncbi:MAG: TRAM domain-containing protein [Candidatus Hydrogenedentes bacterium]|nr:TRAM domain-containing protein [Candidatus Hydrogenedentota bacterium]